MCCVEAGEKETFANDTVCLFHRGVKGETYETPSGRVSSVTKVTFVTAGLREHPSFVRSKGRRVLSLLLKVTRKGVFALETN